MKWMSEIKMINLIAISLVNVCVARLIEVPVLCGDTTIKRQIQVPDSPELEEALDQIVPQPDQLDDAQQALLNRQSKGSTVDAVYPVVNATFNGSTTSDQSTDKHNYRIIGDFGSSSEVWDVHSESNLNVGLDEKMLGWVEIAATNFLKVITGITNALVAPAVSLWRYFFEEDTLCVSAMYPKGPVYMCEQNRYGKEYPSLQCIWKQVAIHAKKVLQDPTYGIANCMTIYVGEAPHETENYIILSITTKPVKKETHCKGFKPNEASYWCADGE